jgi:hypothetical protein
MLTRMFKLLSQSLLACIVCMSLLPTAWAYKVEKVCEDVPASAKEPAYKKCKVVRVKEGGAGGKAGDAKGDGHGEPKKEVKPAGH